MAANVVGNGHTQQPLVNKGRPIISSTAGPSIAGYTLLESRSNLATLFKALAAELLGTLLFVFIATGVVTSGCHTKDVSSASGSEGDTTLSNATEGSCFLNSTSSVLNIALAFGFGIFVVVYFTASFSGGHINPAVTLGMFLAQRISALRAVLYIIVQCGGAAIASIVLKGLDPSGFRASGGAANQVNRATGTSVGTALGFEIILTFALVFTIFAATDSQRALSTAPLPILAPLAIGMVVFLCHLVGIPIDGTSINPARSFGPAVVAHQYHNFWIFWVGPFAGAIVAAAVYELVFKTWHVQPRSDPSHPQGDLEAGIPITSNADIPLHSGTAGLEEKQFTEARIRPATATI